jgi:farnesyl-diphosphate farnesyltransferase
LRSVSRSFYLSVRLLPVGLRDPIALAYLLARATDTIADTVEIEAAIRLKQLEHLASLIQGNAAADAGNSLATFATHQKDESERRLLEKIPSCLRWLESLAPDDQADIREALADINEGQRLDVERFAHPEQLAALATAAELDRYTYLVAGCVGEFWTKLCFRHLPRFSREPMEQMLSLGRQYGQGLQLVNILRDTGADLRAGRCYWPADELHSLGLSPEELPARATDAMPLIDQWRRKAEQGIAAGLEYACAVRPFRVRLATVLPALVGARTLALLRNAGAKALEEKIKVPRREVRQIVFGATRTLASPRSLRAIFARLSR